MKKKSLVVAVVDDDASVRKALGRLLRAHEYLVEIYASGPEFLCHLKTSVPDFAVLDVSMQPMSGLDIQEEIVRRGISLPIVFISAVDDDTVRAQALKQGAVAYLPKLLAKLTLLDTLAGISPPSAR